MKTLLEVFEVDDTPFERSGFSVGKKRWSAKYMYEHTKKRKLKIETICLRHVDMSSLPWNDGAIGSISNFIYISFFKSTESRYEYSNNH